MLLDDPIIEDQAFVDYLFSTCLMPKRKTESTGGGERTPPPAPGARGNGLTDAELLDRAARARNGGRFRTLFHDGDISAYPSASEADQALANIFAFWCGPDQGRIDAFMRQSALLQKPERLAKWNKVHVHGLTYGENTVRKAIADATGFYSPRERKSAPARSTREQAPKADDNLTYTEDDLATDFVERYKDSLRFCHDSGRWYGWKGSHWETDLTRRGFDLVRGNCKRVAAGVGKKERRQILKAATVAAVERFAQADRALAVTNHLWDKDLFLLGTPGGTVDLRTGVLRPARQEDFITKITSVTPAEVSTPPLWTQFLNEATGGNADLQRFLRQVAGMVLTGDTSEQILFFIYGPGGNGKSVFLHALTEILGPYAKTAPMETFAASNSDRHPTDLAMLCGARLVSASETEEGRAWAESRIKQLTGGDEITARFMRRDFFSFTPQFKLVIVGNHKPNIRCVDDAIRRRVLIIPFTHRPETVDPKLNHKLRPEYPAILRWAIEGCLDWQQNGLIRPACVTTETQDYFTDQDVFGGWIADCCNLDPIFSASVSDLFASWKTYAEQNGLSAGNTKSFGGELTKRGFERIRSKKARKFKGICLKKQDNQDSPYGTGSDY